MEQAPIIWPLALYSCAVLLLVVAMIGISRFIGERHRERATDVPYESGMIPTGEAWVRFDVRYYLIAMFFVIFDVESVFIFAWAVAARDAGWPGYIEVAIFMGVLLSALAYLWRVGALEWAGKAGPAGRQQP